MQDIDLEKGLHGKADGSCHGASSWQPMSQGLAKITGMSKCHGCHSDQTAEWITTPRRADQTKDREGSHESRIEDSTIAYESETHIFM